MKHWHFLASSRYQMFYSRVHLSPYHLWIPFHLYFSQIPHLIYQTILKRIIRGEVEESGLEFSVCEMKIFSYCPCSQRSVRKLKKCDISLKWEVKTKIIWRVKISRNFCFPNFSDYWWNQGDTVLVLTPVDSETLPVCTVFLAV